MVAVQSIQSSPGFHCCPLNLLPGVYSVSVTSNSSLTLGSLFLDCCILAGIFVRTPPHFSEVASTYGKTGSPGPALGGKSNFSACVPYMQGSHTLDTVHLQGILGRKR